MVYLSKFGLSCVPHQSTVFTDSLSSFCDWSKQWQLIVAYHKCNYICFGNLKIPFPQYSLGDIILPRVNHVTDLGVLITSDLKPSVQCSHCCEAFGHLSVLLKGFQTSDISILILAYKIYVRPILEYNSPVWNLWLISDIKCVERVQHFFTRALCKLVGLSYLFYSIRLQNFNLRSLEYRRVFCDLV